MIILGLFAMMAASSADAAPSDPLGPAISGELQCHSPDTARKICRSLAAYSRDANGEYSNTAVVLLSTSEPVTMETTTPVRIVGAAVCGAIRFEDVARGKIAVGGKEMTPEDAKPNLAQVSKSMAHLMGHEICTRYEDVGGALMAKASLDGVYNPDFDQLVLWVKPSEGYRVAP